MLPSFGVVHNGCFAAHIPLDLDFVGLHDFAWGCVRWVDWFGRTQSCLDREFVDRGHFGTNFAGRRFRPQLGSFCAAWIGHQYGFRLRMHQYRLEPCRDRDSLWSWHCSRNSGCHFVCDGCRLHLHCNRQAFWQFGFIRAMVLPNRKLLSHEGRLRTCVIPRVPVFSGSFLEVFFFFFFFFFFSLCILWVGPERWKMDVFICGDKMWVGFL